MGYDAYSKVVFGVKVSKNEIIFEETVRSCNHNTDLNANFCSVCGKPVYETQETILVDYGYSPNEIAYFVSSSDSDKTGVLGFLLSETGSQDTNYYAIPQPSEKMVNELKKFLTENGFHFEDKDLKSYLYTEHSY